jgi:hypothetical protein
MYPKHPLFQKCLTCLESLPNFQATIQDEPYISREFLADGKLIIQTDNATINYICEIKTGLNHDLVESVTEYFFKLSQRLPDNQRPLLITRGLSSLIVEQFIDRNLEFIDVDGSIYLNSPGLYVMVRRSVAKDKDYTSLDITVATLQVMYVLLKSPQLMLCKDNFEETIANLANITTRTVKNSLKKLEELGYIEQQNKRYKIIDYLRLMERWELGYNETLRGKLLLGNFSSVDKKKFSEIAIELQKNAKELNYLIGGELAASIMTNYLRPIGATLHLKNNSDLIKIAIKMKLKPDKEGNIFFLKCFDNDSEKFDNLAHPLLIHAELLWTGNSRLKETAQLIYDQYIKEIAEKNDWFSRKTSFA